MRVPTHTVLSRALPTLGLLAMALPLAASCSGDNDASDPGPIGGTTGMNTAVAGQSGGQEKAASVNASAVDGSTIDGSAGGENHGQASAAATACGGPGEDCCDGYQCDAGCCVSGVCRPVGQSCGGDYGQCEADGTCTNCGAQAEDCCPGGTCAAGLACSGSNRGSCESCGKAGELCCAGDKCSEGACVCGSCQVGCGALGEDCCECPGGRALGAAAAGTAAAGCQADLTCIDDDCVVCGTEGEACCPGQQCDGELGCLDDICQLCGDPGQACCDTPGTDGCPGPENDCTAEGVCEGNDCGRDGEVCCSGEQACSDGLGLGCVDGTCRYCGDAGEVCCQGAEGDACRGNAVCKNNTCEACGAKGEPCCAAETCFGAGLACVNAACEASP